MPRVSVGAKRLAYEKEIKKRINDFDIRLLFDYIESLEAERYKSLLQSTNEYETSLLLGELKAYRKLLNSLSINEEPSTLVLK